MVWRRLWSLLLFLLVLASLGACAYLYRTLRQEQTAQARLEQEVAAIGPRFDQFKQAVRDVDRRLSATVFQEVDLAATGCLNWSKRGPMAATSCSSRAWAVCSCRSVR